jgi:chromosomal replication initiator protein
VPDDFSGHPLAALQAEVGTVQFRSWLRHLDVDRDGEEVRVIAPSNFIRDWNRQHYGDRIRRVLGASHVEFVVAAGGR